MSAYVLFQRQLNCFIYDILKYFYGDRLLIYFFKKVIMGKELEENLEKLEFIVRVFNKMIYLLKYIQNIKVRSIYYFY